MHAIQSLAPSFQPSVAIAEHELESRFLSTSAIAATKAGFQISHFAALRFKFGMTNVWSSEFQNCFIENIDNSLSVS
jgi:hypothetical protein